MSTSLSHARLEQLFHTFAQSRILVVGDLMLDEFLWGKVTRISPEAPVPVIDIQRRAAYPGGAANVARTIASLGAQASVAGIVGEDEPGKQLLHLLPQQGIGVSSVRVTPQRPTTHKTRICAITRQLHAHLDIEDQQQIVRVDEESRSPLDAASKQWLLENLKKEVRAHDAIIIEDYAKGLIDQEIVSVLLQEARIHHKIAAIDPNPQNPLDWSSGTVLKPNRREAFLAAGLPYSEKEEDIMAAAEILQQKHGIRFLLITLGEAGMLLLENGQKPYHTPTRAQDVFDVSGAGDTAIAAFTLALTAGATGIEAAEVANHAAGVVVGKLGTATLTLEELRGSFKKTNGAS